MNLRSQGRNPRALGTNPRARGINRKGQPPAVKKDRDAPKAWKRVLQQVAANEVNDAETMR